MSIDGPTRKILIQSPERWDKFSPLPRGVRESHFWFQESCCIPGSTTPEDTEGEDNK